jgi:hypothetical protein
MATRPAPASALATRSAAFERFAGYAGLITGISSILYAVFFLLVEGPLNTLMPPLLLAIGGIAASAVITAVYARVREADPTFALWALLLGVIGQLGGAIHGVHDLAEVLVPLPSGAPDVSKLPNQHDPRGLLAFGLTGVATLVFAWLIVRGGQLPRNLGYLGYMLGVALVALFLGNLFTNDASSLFVLVPGGLASLIANPAWNIWVGLSLLRK